MGNKNTAKTYDIAKAAAAEALKDFKEEERQRNNRTRYHNTELLLKNYLTLQGYFESTKDKIADIMSAEDLEELKELGADDIIINSLVRARMRTLTMVAHVEQSLENLKELTTLKGQPVKYTVIECLYLDKARRHIEHKELIKVIAEELHCGEASVYRWRKEMIHELSVLLYGVDGLRLDI